MTKRFEVCKDVNDLKAGEAFEWVNSTDEDCVVVKCKPPLVKNRYPVKKHGRTPANVQDPIKPGNYDYDCDCNGERAQPKIIIRAV